MHNALLRPITLLLACILPHAVTGTAVTSNTADVCTKLHARYPDKLIWDPAGPKGWTTLNESSTYNTVTFDYWNAAVSLDRAACMFVPANAEEVSFAVTTLRKYPDVRFALKGAGHNPNRGYSSTKGGVLIAFRPNSRFVIPSADLSTVTIGPGCKWEDVYGTLSPLGKTVTGGRLGDVGVAGLLLGSGLSYLSGQHGFACDNVVNYEVVLANATITNANSTSHPDLFYALCGGGNQYAIVTRFTLKMYESGVKGVVWGGVRSYGGWQHSDVLEAVARFTSDNTDPRAAIIPTFNFVTALVLDIPAIAVAMFYDGPAPPPGVFDMFDDIKSISDSTKAQDMPGVTRELLNGDMKGLRFRIAFNSFPAMPLDNMTDFLNDHYALIQKASIEAALWDLLDFKDLSFAVQPMPRHIMQASKDANANGGNALGLDPRNGDKVWIEYDFAWLSPLCDGACDNFIRKIVKDAHNLHATKYGGIYPTNYENGDLESFSYNPIFMNDALDTDPVLESYGAETYARLRAIQRAYDPDGFMATRQGGFSFTE